MKENCFQKKISELLKKMGNMIKKKEEKKKEKKRKKEQKREMMEIQKLRASQSEFVKKGERWILKWKGIPVGHFIGPGVPKPTNEMGEETFPCQPIDVLLKKKTALQKFPLINRFSNVCGCSTEEIGSKAFAEHTKSEHKGYIQPNNQLNRPPWIDWEVLGDDETENSYFVSPART